MCRFRLRLDSLSFRYIPNNSVGVVEKLWSRHGSVPEGGIIAIHQEAGFQSELLRGGVHFGYWRWQFRVHRAPLVTISQGKIGSLMRSDDATEPDHPASVDSIGVITVHDGPSLPPDEIIAPIVGSDSQAEDFHNNFQNAEAFLRAGGRRGCQ